MPLQCRPSLTALPIFRRWPQATPFHSTPVPRDDVEDRHRKNHYETLNLHPGASPAEIKKSFYTLSKSHHPDTKPADPSAPRRFLRISEAYAVLSHPTRRATYDRDVLHLHHHHHHPHPSHKGSYSSTQAGGRPPSGLSRRRTTFTGPPPSFYRSGGWGTQARKRAAAHDESTGGSGGGGASSQPHHPQPDSQSQHWGGMGPGQDPFGHRDEVLHFDKAGHERTQRWVDERRVAAARRRAQWAGGREFYGTGANYVLSIGLFVFAIGLPLAWGTGEARQLMKEGEERRKAQGS